MTPHLFRCPCACPHCGPASPPGADIFTAQNDDTAELDDSDLLAHSTALGRVLFTQDIRFKARAEDWQREAQPFAGLFFGEYVRDLDLITKAPESAGWIGKAGQLP